MCNSQGKKGVMHSLAINDFSRIPESCCQFELLNNGWNHSPWCCNAESWVRYKSVSIINVAWNTQVLCCRRELAAKYVKCCVIESHFQEGLLNGRNCWKLFLIEGLQWSVNACLYICSHKWRLCTLVLFARFFGRRCPDETVIKFKKFWGILVDIYTTCSGIKSMFTTLWRLQNFSATWSKLTPVDIMCSVLQCVTVLRMILPDPNTYVWKICSC